jgi:hypothetical protein
MGGEKDMTQEEETEGEERDRQPEEGSDRTKGEKRDRHTLEEIDRTEWEERDR